MNGETGESDFLILERIVAARHSSRAFLKRAIPRKTIDRILVTAQNTASWCNTQPWTTIIVSGAARDRLSQALLAAARAEVVHKSDLTFPTEYRGVYQERRRASGYQLYNSLGIERGDHQRYQEQGLRNYAFFDAPYLAVICADKGLATYGAIDCGGYVTTFLLAARALGVDTVPQASLAQYSEVIRDNLSISNDLNIVCGISFGIADREHPSNGYRTPRERPGSVVQFIG